MRQTLFDARRVGPRVEGWRAFGIRESHRRRAPLRWHYFELISKHSLRIVVLWLFLSDVYFGQRMRTLQYGTWKGECEARARFVEPRSVDD